MALLTNTQIAAPDVLRIYRDEDKVEKASAHIKPHLDPSICHYPCLYSPS
jgi:hypothetical protein